MAGQFEFIKDHWIVIEAVEGNDGDGEPEKESSSKKKDKVSRKRRKSSDDSDVERIKKKKRKKKSSKKRSKRKRNSSSSDSDSSDSSGRRKKKKKKSSKKSKLKKHKVKKDKTREKDKEKEKGKEKEKEKEKEREKEKEKDKEKEKIKEKEREKEKEKEKAKEKSKEKVKEKEKEKEKDTEKEKEKDKEKGKEKSEKSKRKRDSSPASKASTSHKKESTSNDSINPSSLVKYTSTKPSIQFSVNARNIPDLASFSYDSLKTGKPFVKKFIPLKPEKILVKLNSVKVEKNETPQPDFVDLSPSEKRVLEKLKKQQQKELEKEGVKKLKSELKTDAIATYYSSKKCPAESNETLKPAVKEVSTVAEPAEVTEAAETKEVTDPLTINPSEIKEIKTEPSEEAPEKPKEEKCTTPVQESKDTTGENNSEKPKQSEESCNRKMTAKELLDKVRAKKGSEVSNQSKLMSKYPIIGKIRRSVKKEPAKNENSNSSKAEETTVRPTYSVNLDYQWYLQYYMSAYNLDLHSASYYAQYHISTSGEYRTTDLSSWYQNQGYNVLSIPYDQVQPTPPTVVPPAAVPLTAVPLTTVPVTDVSLTAVPPTVLPATVAPTEAVPTKVEPELAKAEFIEEDESSDQYKDAVIAEVMNELKDRVQESMGTNFDDTNKSIEMRPIKEEKVDANPENQDKIVSEAMEVESSDTLINSEITTNEPAEVFVKKETATETGNNDSSEIIQVIVPSTPLSANEMILASNKSPEPEFYREDAFDCESPPPPPPPAPQSAPVSSLLSSPPPPPPVIRPTMTHLKTTQEIVLPNGQKLPPGTEQIIIHPYPSSHPFSNYFNADSFAKGLAENTSQENASNLKSPAVLTHVIS